MSFTYRERHSRNDYGIVSQTPSSLFPPIENKLVDIPGGHGAYMFGNRYGIRELVVPIAFVWKKLSDYQSRMNLLTEWLSPGSEPEPLIFDLEPNRTYYVILSDQTDVEKIGRTGQGELVFICPDPFKYGEEQTTDVAGSVTIANEGTAITYPKFRTIVPFDTSRVVYGNHSYLTPEGTPRYIRLGVPTSPMQEQVEPLELVMHDTMRSTQSWQTATEIDNGFITGEMDVNQHGFYARLYDSPVDYKRWQGPSLIRAIGESLQDFRADIFIRLMNTDYETGMIEVYFRDANGNRVAKIGFEDGWVNAVENQGKARIGPGSNYHDIYTKADNPIGWNDFDGIIRIERVGNIWRPYFAQIRDGGRHSWVRGNLRYTDNANRATAPITHVQVAIRKYPGTDEADMAIKEIKLYRVNNVEDSATEVPLSFKEGDEVEVDCSNGLVTVNGEERTDLIELGTEFFGLIEGLNRLSSNFGMEVTWRNRYL